MTWTVHVHGCQLASSPHSPLSPLPEKVSPSTLAGLVNLLDRAYLYPGHPDKNFLDMANSRKGKLTSTDGKVTAFIDELGGSFNGRNTHKLFVQLDVLYLYMEESVTRVSHSDPH